MGNYDTRSIKSGTVFRQSLSDFPCPVALGKYAPSFGLYRFKQGLSFVPPDDEGFTMRGGKQRLLYKGRRRSHRFTILGDTAFEYDCILEREPESNVISLRMEGAENYEFFRQPDFVPDEFLKGSYAVYKKETLIGEGTGKLCHIHRPEIIDARGRRCWGDLAVAGNELLITIPEWFLSGAKYPVIVDPTIGTTTVGSQYKWDADPPEPWVQLMFEIAIPVNRFLVSDTINGTCTAYMYSYVDNYGEAGGRPVLYSDNGNSPLTRKSMNEGFADFTVKSGKPAGWRSATFSSNGAISSGSYIWFGVFTEYFWEPKFDYGYKCYSSGWDNYNSIPNTYPLYSVNWYENFKLSMYFTYTAGQNYTRTLTQGVSLSDNRRIKEDFRRTTAQTVQVSATPTRLLAIIKRIQEALQGLDFISFSLIKIRTIQEWVNLTDTMCHLRTFIRGLMDIAGVEGEAKTGWVQIRNITDTVQAVGIVFRGLLLFVKIVTVAFVRDYLLSRFLKSRQELVLKSAISRKITIESKIA
jgi:hypothetical protein